MAAEPAGAPLIRAVEEWLRENDGRLTWRREELPYETVFSIEPRNPRAAPVTIRVATASPDCDIFAGRHAQWADLKTSPGELLEILRAISAGSLVENVVERNGRALATEATLPLESRVLSAKNWTWKYVLFGRSAAVSRRALHYQDYSA